MNSIAMSVFLDSEPGELIELPQVGCGLEHPLVYDRAAREIQALEKEGRAVVVEQRESAADGEVVINALKFRRLR